MTELRIVTESIGGSALARLAADGAAPAAWYAPRPRSPEGWRAHVAEVRDSFDRRDWLGPLMAALEPTGAAAERLARVREGGGVLVTTGQQPGLFGGPIYTWSKALGALALADEIERATGVPTAPLFWAATDDADFAEAASTVVARIGGADRIVLPPPSVQGAPMSRTPLGDVGGQFRALLEGAGSAVDGRPFEIARRAYHPDATIGGAYVDLLRALLEPLGIPVLDASHAAVLDSERTLLVGALDRSRTIASAVRARDAELVAAGHAPQVTEVEGLSLVFVWEEGGKRRLPIGASVPPGSPLSPNVLLRPVIERTLLPTVAYAAGPGEIAYFAQATAVADALGAARPLVVPRWSGTIIEPHVANILAHYGLTPDDLRDPHAAETRLARASLGTAASSALDAARAVHPRLLTELRSALADEALGSMKPVVEGVERAIDHRFDRLERRIVAAVKRRESQMMSQIATARGALHPYGVRQERALNVLPLLARHGAIVFDRMLEEARRHARQLIDGASLGGPRKPAAESDIEQGGRGLPVG